MEKKSTSEIVYKEEKDDECLPRLFYMDHSQPLTKEEDACFDEIMKPKNHAKSAKDVDLTQAAEIVRQNIDSFFK